MTTTDTTREITSQVASGARGDLHYDVFINEPSPQDGVLPNGEPKRFSPQASTLIYGGRDAVLTDPGMTTDQAQRARRLGRRQGPEPDGHLHHARPRRSLVRRRAAGRTVRGPRRRLRGHDRADARPTSPRGRCCGTSCTRGIPPSPVTAVTVPGNRFTLEGHDLVIVEVGHTDSDGQHRPARPGSRACRRRGRRSTTAFTCISASADRRRLRALAGRDRQGRGAAGPGISSAGHQNKELDDDAGRTIAETRQYLDDADELLRTENTAAGFFNAKIERYPDHLGRIDPVGRCQRASTACATTPKKTSARSSSAPGCNT